MLVNTFVLQRAVACYPRGDGGESHSPARQFPYGDADGAAPEDPAPAARERFRSGGGDEGLLCTTGCRPTG
jgi:hypothetical protein